MESAFKCGNKSNTRMDIITLEDGGEEMLQLKKVGKL